MAGKQDHLADERPELHGDVAAAIGLTVHHQREPALQVPRQRRDHLRSRENAVVGCRWRSRGQPGRGP